MMATIVSRSPRQTVVTDIDANVTEIESRVPLTPDSILMA